jgi:hypothetical protein
MENTETHFVLYSAVENKIHLVIICIFVFRHLPFRVFLLFPINVVIINQKKPFGPCKPPPALQIRSPIPALKAVHCHLNVVHFQR